MSVPAEHRHGAEGTDHSKAFGIGVALNVAFVIAELSFGLLAHSLALLAHVVLEPRQGNDELLDRSARELRERFAIGHTTIQIERSGELASQPLHTSDATEREATA